MSLFTELCDWYEPIGGIRFRTTCEVPWEIGKKGSGLWLRVPLGFSFDVSIPWWLRWWLNPKDPRYLKAAALHDFALEQGWDRVSAAASFSEALRAARVRRLRRLAMVLAVIVYRFFDAVTGRIDKNR